MTGQTRTPAAILALVEAMTNPTIAGFLLAELAEHRERVRAEANGSQLVEPRMNLVMQFDNQIRQVHGFDPPRPTQAHGPSGDHHPGGP